MPCRQCGRYFEAEVWTIIDIDERPDLLDRIRNETIHVLVCPYCGHTAKVNTPLLILRPRMKPALLFSPASGNASEQDQEHAEALIGMCRDHLGDGWKDDWLAEGLPIVTRSDLVSAINSEIDAIPVEEVNPLVRSTLEQIFALLSAEGVRVTSPEELQRALESRPELKAKLAKVLQQTK